ncbi:MAG: tetratricopeptide repeat protein [Candidatus Tectomicrobia bacterium]|nr:tetratricopeptide repeat protein [Candidatus Tectomicrobia bacterium]
MKSPVRARSARPCRWNALLGAALAFLLFAWSWAPAQPSSVYLRMILVKDKAAAKKVADLLARGRPFPDVASEYSTDPTKERAGFLGKVALKDLNEQIRGMVGSLKTGGVIGPIQVQDGIAFFQHTTVEHYTEALQLMRLEKYQEALAPLDKDLSLNPDRVHSWTLKAYALQRLNRSKEAKETYQKIIERDPKSILAYNNLGTLLDLEGKHAEAARMFERAVALDPSQDVILHNLAWLHSSRLGDLSKALTYIQKAIALKPDAPNYHAMLGDIYHRMGKREEARKAMARAVELDPSNAEHKRIFERLTNPAKPATLKKTATDAPPAAAAPDGKKADSTPRGKPPARPADPEAAPTARLSPPPPVPSIKVVTRTGGAEATRLVQRLLQANGFPVAFRLSEPKPLDGIRVYYKPGAAGAARKIRDLITPRPELRQLAWKSQFDIIVFVGK